MDCSHEALQEKRVWKKNPGFECENQMQSSGTVENLTTRCQSEIYRGYYTVVRRYEFYVQVARTISHEWAKRTSEILFLPREHKIHIFEPTCNVLLLYFNRSKRRESWRHWMIYTPLGSRMKWRMESTSGLVSSKTISVFTVLWNAYQIISHTASTHPHQC